MTYLYLVYFIIFLTKDFKKNFHVHLTKFTSYSFKHVALGVSPAGPPLKVVLLEGVTNILTHKIRSE